MPNSSARCDVTVEAARVLLATPGALVDAGR
jgi:hypothetical protein